MMDSIVYIQLKPKVHIKEPKNITLSMIAHIKGPSGLQTALRNYSIYQYTEEDENVVVLDSFYILDQLYKNFPYLEYQFIGYSETMILMEKPIKRTPFLLVGVIWLLLFVGAGMAIINFHYDVSMQQVQQKLHYMITGKEEKYPLWIQIPYSFGLGLGMVLFFNHVFKKRINEEPSPLEIEMNNYQSDIDKYLIKHQNKTDPKS
ncbi:stage V sporulation protein AA [Bacillaceae bacterium S4-13-58]